MVLQRELPARVWGQAHSDAVVEVGVQGQTVSCVADKDGRWECELQPLDTSEDETLEVRAGDELVVLDDVAVGEVFIAAGQSNMEYWMRYDHMVEAYRLTCDNPRVRFFDQPKCSYPGQMDDFDYSKVGMWRKATPEDLDYFSAVGYYFARGLEVVLDAPVGIVGCNYGGTKSLAWMRPEHARVVQPEQTAAFERNLQGLSYEELLSHGRLNPHNDKGYATWPAWNEFFLPQTPSQEEIANIIATEDMSLPAQLHPGLMAPTKDAPGALFTHMVLPIAGFVARGVLWYQGESDDEDAGAQVRHAEALRTIISDWREAWRMPELPFLVVQLPGFGSWWFLAGRDWPSIRAGQQQVADEDAHVWLCSIGDMGNKLDIHPKSKKPVGERLALLALAHLLGQDLLADAPRCVEATRDGSKVVLRFNNTGEGLQVDGNKIEALEVRCNGAIVPFHAAVPGNRLILVLEDSADGPLEVRFAQTNWYRINLYNSVGIPALPFVATC
jgi:sialate O-acetylesterase